MKKYTKKIMKILTLGTLAASLSLTGGCGKDDEKTSVSLIFKCQNQFWETPKTGAEDAGKELDMNLSFDTPETEDVKEQAKRVKDAVSRKVDAIIIAPTADDDELADALKYAQNNGIKIITIDSDIREEVRSSCISTNNTYAGAIAARQAAEILGGQGEIGIVIHLETATNAQERKGGFVSQIDEYNQPEDKDEEETTDKLNIVATESGNGNISDSKDAAKKIISENPDVKLLFATSQSTTIGTCMAVDELGKADSVQVIGFDSFERKEGSKSSNEYLDSGVLDGFILQNPYNEGYLGVRYARDLIDGQSIATAIDTGATLVTKDNINNSDIQLIMNPTKLMEDLNNG